MPDTIGAYGANSSLGSYQRQWDDSGRKNVPWMDDRKKRIAIRTFSRGLIGAAFFTVGGMYARPSIGMKGYTPETWQITKPLHVIAKILDTFAGEPIKFMGNMLGRNGEKWVRFRPTSREFSPNSITGRTLGEEMVGVTFDFFCASVGDAWGRDIVGWFDPSVKKDWLDDKGHIKFPEAIKSAAKSITRYVTYNGGEDWFVALPYVYFIRGQRKLLNHFSPGFMYDSDRNLNGGSLKIDKNNKVIGNFNKEGIVDLQGRFTVYNIGTLMFRELYDHAQHLVAGKEDHLYGTTNPDPKTGITGWAGNVAKWVARSAVKAGLYMTPAVPFFWVTRTPQSKYKGLFIHQDRDTNTATMLSYANGGKPDAVYANEYHKILSDGTKFNETTPIFRGHYLNHNDGWKNVSTNYDLFNHGENYNAYSKSFGTFDRGLNTVGAASNKVRKGLHHLPGKLGMELGNGQFQKYKRVSDRFWNASTAYTPYMIAKGEAALLWDSGKMDMSAERMVDGASHLNWNEFKAGAGEVWRTFLHQPLADPAREAEGNRRSLLDRAKPDIFTETEAQMEEEEKRAAAPSWRDRVISGKPAEKPVATTSGDGASLEDTYKVAKRGAFSETAARKPVSHTEQEEMREALAKLPPPTNSVH